VPLNSGAERNLTGWQDGDTLFIGVTAWRDLAENVAESARKATG
jgi:single-stranded DNA-binding protein